MLKWVTTRHYLSYSIILIVCSFLLVSSPISLSEEMTVVSKSEKDLNDTLDTLSSIIKVKSDLKKDLRRQKANLKLATSVTEQDNLKRRITVIEKKLASVDSSFEEIATNMDLSLLKDEVKEKFNLQEELVVLIKPILEEVNHITKDVRKKSELRENLEKFRKKKEDLEKAIENINGLIKKTKNNKALKKALKETATYWKQQEQFVESQYQSASLQLRKLAENDLSFAKSTQNYFKAFFQQRGFYLLQALFVVIFLLLFSHFSRYLLKRFVPSFNKNRRSFRIRLVDLFHRVITIISLIVGPMIVFYMVEDWVLFSFSILLLIGVGWGLRTAIPVYWSQIQLFLNIGAVREGERIFLEGIPWRVGVINIFCILENPVAGIKQRVPIKDLINLKSRPSGQAEPWFPCTKGDWVILSDGIRGKVIGISHEMVKLIQRGGAHKMYLTSEFLGLSPLNLSVDFRIKETIGISYDLQEKSTNEILITLEKYIHQRIKEEGYADDLLSLRVEFELANTSSLDLVVIADFKGRLGDLYNRLRRAIQRWCVDACTENEWEIPFTQVTLHGDK